jgi:hypothetical protein
VGIIGECGESGGSGAASAKFALRLIDAQRLNAMFQRGQTSDKNAVTNPLPASDC